MSCKFFSPLGSKWNGFRRLSLSIIFFSGLVVTRNRIQRGSLQNWLAITSSNSFRPWYSLSSKPSITVRMFLPGSDTVLRGSLKSSANKSSTPRLSNPVPTFRESCSTRARSYSGRAWDKWQAKDWSISRGFRYRKLLCWQKWLPDSLPASCILWQITAAITDLPIPASPLITSTRFSEHLSSSQSSTTLTTQPRVSGWYLPIWNSMSPLNSDLARFLRISFDALSSNREALGRLFLSILCISSTTCCVFFWARITSFSCDLISASLSTQSNTTFRYCSSPQRSSFSLSISAWSNPRATSATLSSCQRAENVEVSTPVEVTWPYNSLRKYFK